jgi:predicted DNA binding CopG/RHH family protein
MKKKHIKEIENVWSKIPSVSPTEMAKIRKRNTMLKAKKEARVTMRMNAADLEALKQIADDKGIKYQSLIGMVLREYVAKAS